MINNRKLFVRGIVLFMIGALFTMVLKVLRTQQQVSHAQKWKYEIFCSKWWLPLFCGCSSALVGLIYPELAKQRNEKSVRFQDWSHVLRCVTIFVGINEACIKVEFTSDCQLSTTLAVLSLALWCACDRSPLTLAVGVCLAAAVTLAAHLLHTHHLCLYTEKEFSYVRSWLPYVVFTGGITMANIGQQLAVNDYLEGESKPHKD